MSYNFNIDDFKELYINQLLNKEEILKKLNIGEYIYKTIIKDFGLKRPKTNKMNRFKTLNNIEIIKIDNTPIEIIKLDINKNINKNMDDELITSIKSKLEASKLNRTKKK